MSSCMIYKDPTNTPEENKQYEQAIDAIAQRIIEGHFKGKKVLLITGSGISASVPCMQELMKQIEFLINNYDGHWDKSDVFKSIFNDYLVCDASEKHQMQSRLLTYIQNAYLDKRKYVQEQDVKPLSHVWSSFVIWLLYGDRDTEKIAESETTEPTTESKPSESKEVKGIIEALPSENHRLIRDLYELLSYDQIDEQNNKRTNVISITTNFDNLLWKAFAEEKNYNFYPILDIESFDKYYMSDKDDHSYIEIQSRGDVFWLECTGSNSKICPNKHKQCYVPGESVQRAGEIILCNLCKSEAKIYFAFPGTKEKDTEMSKIINGVWKYLANSIGYVIVIGNSMNYDPVLVEFLRELIRKRNVPVLYISRCKKDAEGNVLKGLSEIYQKAATKFLFGDYEKTQNIWARSKETDVILRDLLTSLQKKKGALQREYDLIELKREIEFYDKKVTRHLFAGNRDNEDLKTDLRLVKYISDVLDIEKITQMQHFSQLGLKTFWLHEESAAYNEHNRLNHSIGVMMIASYLYFKVCSQPTKEELTFLQLAALFHDIGHLPFSHLLEEVFEEFGWVTVGESTTFNHEQHTKYLIEKLVKENPCVKKLLKEIGYSADELQQLINGEYGKGYLDALINSPVDCDKIEYLFSDSIFTHRGTCKDFQNFIQEYASALSSNANHFLVLQGDSTKSFLKLIRMRGEMYDQVYLRSGLRYLEACCKLIIRTFLAYVCAGDDIFSLIEDKNTFPEYFNLSDSKIYKIVDFMEKCTNELNEKTVCEISILKKMVAEINKNLIISDLMRETVKKCMSLIEKTRGIEAVARIEKDRILTYEISNSNFDKAILKQLLKNLYLRFPGIILIDYVESKSSFSFGKREMRRRSDGTRSATENILIKDIRQIKGLVDTQYKCLGDVVADVNRELNYSTHSYINIYRISDNLFSYMQAEDYVLNELQKEGIINER